MSDDYTSNSATAGRLAQNGSVAGRLEVANDEDWFRAELVAGVSYTFELSSPAGIDSKNVLSFYDSDGKRFFGYLGEDRDPVLVRTFKAPASGTYFLGVQDYSFGSGFVAKAYTLRNTAALGDDAGDTEATARGVTVGQTVSARLETTADRDVFRIALEAGVTYQVFPTSGSGGYYTGSLSVSGAGFAPKDVAGRVGDTTFTATQSGDYFLTAQNLNGSDTSYQFVVGKVADDHAANQAGAGSLVVGAAPIGGKLEVAGDRDWYGVTLQANTTYQFYLAGGAEGEARYASSTALLQMIDATGKAVKAAASYTLVDAAHPHVLQFVPQQTGTYYLEVGDYGSPSGTYTVRAVAGQNDDYADSIDKATTITGQVSGKLSTPQDHDVFKMAVTQGHTYIVELTGQDLVGGARPTVAGSGISTYGHNQQVFNKPGVNSYFVLQAGSTGDYAFTVSNKGAGGTADYTLKVYEPSGDDFAGGRDTTGTVAVGGSSKGRLDYTGDADCFKVTLAAGGSYAFQLRGAGTGEGTLADGGTYLTAWDSTGGASLQDHGSGVYTLSGAAGGDYYVAVRPNTGSSNMPSDMTGSYTLHATALTGDTTAPTLTGSSYSVGPYGRIRLDFSEAVMRGIGGESVTLRDAHGTVVETFYGGTGLSFAGSTMTIDPTVVLKPGTTYKVELPGSSVLDLASNELAGGSRVVSVGTAARAATGTAGDDYLAGKAVGGVLDGGAGTDMAFFDSARANYHVAVNGAAATVSFMWGSDAPTQLTGIERLSFADGAVALDVEGVAGQAYRLYQAAFDRAPDHVGLGFWIAAMDKGISLTDVARDFIRSDEFVKAYGTASSDTVFLTNLHQNVLHRAPDQGGFDFWMDALTRGIERATVLRDFSESTENHNAMAEVIANGFAYTPWG